MKKLLIFLAVTLFLASFVILSCKKELQTPALTSEAIIKTALDAPTVKCALCAIPNGPSIAIQVCAGATGTPAGFSVQWMLKSEFDAKGWPSSGATGYSSFCEASYSGIPACSVYDLGPNVCAEVNIGDYPFDACGVSSECASKPLICGKEYIFRAFAHNDPSGLGKSEFSANQVCSTQPCIEGGCTYTQGYWKTHGPIPKGNNVNVWPVKTLTLGTVSYTDLQLQSIFDTPPAGNGLITLAHQLIAAKLNVANGAAPTYVAAKIAAADALIGGLIIPPVGGGTLAPSATSALVTALTNYNEGVIGPGHCK
ncbi:MAG: hypothetical protein ABIN01_20035 [Ferruginibacter sp.]